MEDEASAERRRGYASLGDQRLAEKAKCRQN